MDIFERASRAKLRFSTSKGQLSTEDLWDLSLTSLDTIAKATNKRLKEEAEESFIETKTKESSENQLQLDILKHVINAKLTAQEAAKKRADTMGQIAKIEAIIMENQDKSLKEKSVDELKTMLAELKA
jgi:DNA-binding phage protein